MPETDFLEVLVLCGGHAMMAGLAVHQYLSPNPPTVVQKTRKFIRTPFSLGILGEL
jgi:hypothetical protein